MNCQKVTTQYQRHQNHIVITSFLVYKARKKINKMKQIGPGGGTAVTALQTAQHTEVAPTG